jgi:hypothetical protein
MAIEVLTKEDLQTFRHELLNDLKQLFETKPPEQKKWLRSSDVRTLMNISAGTLQNMRISGILKPTKIGGILYYDQQEIQKLLSGGKS